MNRRCFITGVHSFTGKAVSRLLSGEGYHITGCFSGFFSEQDDFVSSRNETAVVDLVLASDVIIICATESIACADTIISALLYNEQISVAKREKILIVIGSFTTWGRTPFSDIHLSIDDFSCRRPLKSYLENMRLEQSALKLFDSTSIRVHIIFSGVLYGEGEDIFYPLFKDAWKGEEIKIPTLGAGDNKPPLVHINTLCQSIHSLVQPDSINNLPNILLVADSGLYQHTLKEICTAIQQCFQDVSTKKNSHENCTNLPLIQPMDEIEFSNLLLDQALGSTSLHALQLHLPLVQKTNDASNIVGTHGFIECIEEIKSEFLRVHKLEPKRILLMSPPQAHTFDVGVELSAKLLLQIITVRNSIDKMLSQCSLSKERNEKTNLKLSGSVSEPLDSKKKLPKKSVSNELKTNAQTQKNKLVTPNQIQSIVELENFGDAELLNEVKMFLTNSGYEITDVGIMDNIFTEILPNNVISVMLRRLMTSGQSLRSGYILDDQIFDAKRMSTMQICFDTSSEKSNLKDIMSCILPTHIIYVHTSKEKLIENWEAESIKISGHKQTKSTISAESAAKAKYLAEIDAFFGNFHSNIDSKDEMCTNTGTLKNLESENPNSAEFQINDSKEYCGLPKTLSKRGNENVHNFPRAVREMMSRLGVSNSIVYIPQKHSISDLIEFVTPGFSVKNEIGCSMAAYGDCTNTNSTTLCLEDVCLQAVESGNQHIDHPTPTIPSNLKPVDNSYMEKCTTDMNSYLMNTGTLIQVTSALNSLLEQSESQGKFPPNALKMLGEMLITAGIRAEKRARAIANFRYMVGYRILENLDKNCSMHNN